MPLECAHYFLVMVRRIFKPVNGLRDLSALSSGDTTSEVVPDSVSGSGLRSLQVGILAMKTLAKAFEGSLGSQFDAAAQLILRTTGRLVVSGVGKSGHIGRKVAATLASTGTPALSSIRPRLVTAISA